MIINLNLLPMKGHYFLFNAGTGLIVPFLPVLAKELGFSSTLVGMIYTLLPILAMVAKPMMGSLADRLHWQKGMFISFILLTTISFVFIPWIPSLPRESLAEIHCDVDSVVKMCYSNSEADSDFKKAVGNSSINCKMVCEANASFLDSVCLEWKQTQYCRKPNSTNIQTQTIKFSSTLLPQHTEQINKCLYIRLGAVNFSENQPVHPFCNEFKAVNCSMECDNDYINQLTTITKISDKEAFGYYQFWLFCFALIFGWVSMAVVVSVADAICFELLGEYPSKYGYQRLWGSIGWGLLSFVGGYLIDSFSEGQTSRNYKPAFILMAILLLINAITAWKLRYKQVKTSASILRDVGRLLSEGRVLIFFIWCVCAGMCTAMLWNFLFWYLENSSSKDVNIKTLEGLDMMFQCVFGELPFFFLSGWILKKIGHVHAMTLILIVFGTRFLLYSLLLPINPMFILLIDLTCGGSLAMAYASMASYASIVAPPGTEATTQGLVGAVFEGLGVSSGSFIGGIMMDNMHGSDVFRIFGIAAIIAALIHFIVQYLLSKKTAVLNIHEKDFKHTRYASPTDALHMLEDSLQEFNAQR